MQDRSQEWFAHESADPLDESQDWLFTPNLATNFFAEIILIQITLPDCRSELAYKITEPMRMRYFVSEDHSGFPRGLIRGWFPL